MDDFNHLATTIERIEEDPDEKRNEIKEMQRTVGTMQESHAQVLQAFNRHLTILNERKHHREEPGEPQGEQWLGREKRSFGVSWQFNSIASTDLRTPTIF